MDQSDFTGKSTRKELQGPRPAPLKVRKDSHKIKKPPLAPQQQQQQSHHHHQQQELQPPPQYRPPVIIYTVSPKVIHTNPSEFMTLVQRLTGSSSSSSSSSSYSSSASYPYYSNTTTTFDNNNNNNTSRSGGAVSPAARYATIEKAKSPKGKEQQQHQESGEFGIDHQMGCDDDDDDDDHGVVLERRRSALFPGILSPGPASLPPIQPNLFFSPPPSDPNSLSSFFHDLSPVQHGNKTYMEGSFMNSPSTFFSPNIISPTSMDLFNNFLDF